VERTDLLGRFKGLVNALRRVADGGSPCRWCGGGAGPEGVNAHSIDCPAAVAQAALRLDPLASREGTVTTWGEADEYLRGLHRRMGSESSAAHDGQSYARGVLDGFVLVGLLTEAETRRWAARMASTCPENGLHGCGQSWCTYCGDVCTFCGRPEPRWGCENRDCVSRKADLETSYGLLGPGGGGEGADALAPVGHPGSVGPQEAGDAVLADPGALPVPAGDPPGEGVDAGRPEPDPGPPGGDHAGDERLPHPG
jgi:hypothetical protein